MKAYEVEMSGRVAAPVLDILLPYNEIFVLGSDGKRHPTKEEIEDQLNARLYRQKSDEPIYQLLERFATVAPE